MSYLFPKRVLRTASVLDPVPLTEDFAPAADRISGRLNAHNFDDAIASTVAVDPAAVTETFVYRVAVPFGDTHPATSVEPWTGSPDETIPASGTLNEDAYLVQNTFEWQAITEFDGTAAIVNLSTGVSVLWVHAFAQFLWYGFYQQLYTTTPIWGAQHANGADTQPVNLHFALRVDGTVLADTITGIDNVPYTASFPFKPTQQRLSDPDDPTVNTVLPGPQDIKGRQICAIGPATGPVRISACVPVQPGDHTVEIVVRRVPRQLEDVSPIYTEEDNVYIFSRQVIVTELKSFPVSSVTGADVTTPGFEEEEPVANSTMYVQRIQPLIVAYNDVQEGNLARGALMHYHLPKALRLRDTVRAVFPTPEKFNNVYPGFTSGSIASTHYSGAPAVGWALIGGSPSTELIVENISVAEPVRILVTANVEVVNIYGGEYTMSSGAASFGAFDYSLSASSDYCGGFAVFRLLWRLTGSGDAGWVPLQESTAMVNSFAWIVDRAPYEFAEVQLLAELQFNVPIANIDIGVFGAVMNAVENGTTSYPDLDPGTQQNEFVINRGSMVLLGMRN